MDWLAYFIDLLERAGAPPGLVVMLFLALLLTAGLYGCFGRRRAVHVLVLLVWALCLAVYPWADDWLPRSDSAVAREFAESQHALNEIRLNARYPLGWGIAFADGGGGTLHLDNPKLVETFEDLNPPITVRLDADRNVYLVFSSLRIQQQLFQNASFRLHESGETGLIAADGKRLIAELAKNERDGIMVIFGVR